MKEKAQLLNNYYQHCVLTIISKYIELTRLIEIQSNFFFSYFVNKIYYF